MSELRNRWRTLIVLGLLAGLVAGLVIAAVSGARRTGTAYDRYRHAVAAPDVMFAATQVGIDADYRAVRALPDVVDSGMFVTAPVALKGLEIGTLPPGDDRLYRTIARPLVVDGRLPDPRRADEVLVNSRAAKVLDLGVGDKVTIVTSTDQAALFSEDVEPSGGPTVAATVVGVGDTVLDQLFFGAEPGFIPSSALLAEHPEIPRTGNLLVRLRPGADVKTFHDRANAALRQTNREELVEVGALEVDVPVRDFAEDRKRFVHGTDLERTALLLFALAAALAGVVLVGQALARVVYAMAEAVPALRALGLSRRHLVAGLALPLVTTVLTGAATAAASSLVLSARFPVGLAGRLDPDRGVHGDWPVLVGGLAALAVLVLGGGALSARRGARIGTAEPSRVDPGLVRTIRRIAPLPTAIGAALALDPGKGPRSVPIRPALAGAVAGVVGVVGTLGFVHGIDDALGTPGRAGQAWDVSVYLIDAKAPIPEVQEFVVRHRDVAAAAVAQRQPLDIAGAGVPAYAVEPLRGDLSFVVLEGRAPAAPDEAVVAPSTLKAIGKQVGDRARIGTEQVQIVGSALLPQTAHSSFDQGVWLTSAGFDRLVPGQEQKDLELLIRLRGGARTARFVAEMSELAYVEPSSIPEDVELLRNVRTLPKALAAFLVLLAVAALGHALVTTVRRRRHDFAVLRALGMSPGQTRAVIAWQATTVGLVALVLGIPLGIAIGRVAWRWVAESTPLLYVGPIAAAAILVVIPGALVIANALAAFPARRAGRIRPAVVLRTE